MLGVSLSPARGQAVPDLLAPFFTKSGGGKVAVAAAPDGGLSVWSELGMGHAAWLSFDNTDTAMRLSWRETMLTKLRSVYPVGDMVLSGAWNQMQSSGSGLAQSYTGNRAISTGSVAATATVTLARDAPYDLWVHYTGRVSGGYIRVLIDGTDTLVNEIGDPAGLGLKAFSTYTPTDLMRRQVMRVASGLTGEHTVTLSFGGVATPGGAAIMLEALSISATLGDARILPPIWQPATLYEMGDEVQWQGAFYAARATGTSGATPPAHTSGIASDGALDWRADNRPTYPDCVALDYASEREYAARLAVSGQETEVGGQTHGNEPVTQRTVTLDGVTWQPEVTGYGLQVGSHLAITETTVWRTGAGPDLADCTLQRTITPGELRHEVQITPTAPQADVVWFYAGMLPMVHWDGESGTTVFEAVTGRQGTVTFADYAGQTPPNHDLGSGGRVGLTAQIGTTTLSYGLSVTVGRNGAPVKLASFLRPNLEGRNASGSLDWPAKAYVSPEVTGGWSLVAGDVIMIGSRHVMSVR